MKACGKIQKTNQKMKKKWKIKNYERQEKTQMIRLLSLFTGIGAFEKALRNLNIPYELVGFSEIDKFAIKSYCAIHNVDEKLNLGDIKNIKTEELKEVDFMTWRFSLSRYQYSWKFKTELKKEKQEVDYTLKDIEF